MKHVLSLVTLFAVFLGTAGCGPQLIIPDEEPESITIDNPIVEESTTEDLTAAESSIETSTQRTVTVGEGVNLNENLTYLKAVANREGWFDRDNGACQYFYKMKEDQSYPMTTEDFENGEVKESLIEIVGSEEAAAFANAMVSYLEANTDKEAYQVCSGENGVFVITSSDHTSATLLYWDGSEDTLEHVEDFDDLIDLSYNFYPDALGVQAIMMTGYGDAGYMSWNYYLINTNTLNSLQVEKCSGHFVYEDDGQMTDQFTYECDFEYTGVYNPDSSI